MAQPAAPADSRPLPTIVGIVGAGTMGAEMGRSALEAGCEVVLYDVDEAAVGRGRERSAMG